MELPRISSHTATPDGLKRKTDVLRLGIVYGWYYCGSFRGGRRKTTNSAPLASPPPQTVHLATTRPVRLGRRRNGYRCAFACASRTSAMSSRAKQLIITVRFAGKVQADTAADVVRHGGL